MKRNKQLRQILLVSFLLLSGLLFAFVLERYQSNTAPEHVDSPPPAKADLSFNRFHYSETRDGEPLWELSAASADHDLTTGLTRVKDVTAVFYGQGGRGKMTLTADRGTWQESERKLRISSDVVLKSPDGYTCYADQLVYTEADSHLRSGGPVRLLSSQVEMHGVGLDIDIPGKKLQLLADVWSSWDLQELLKEQG